MRLGVLASLMILWLGLSAWPAAAQRPFERAVALLHSFWYLETFHTKLVAVASTSDNQRPELQQTRAFLGKN